jgi:hypothetical protein
LPLKFLADEMDQSEIQDEDFRLIDPKEMLIPSIHDLKKE